MHYKVSEYNRNGTPHISTIRLYSANHVGCSGKYTN